MHPKTLIAVGIALYFSLAAGTSVRADHDWRDELRHRRDARLRALEHWYRQEREAIDHRYDQRRDYLSEQIRHVSRSHHPHRSHYVRQLDHERDRLNDERRFALQSLRNQYERQRDTIKHEYELSRHPYAHRSGPGYDRLHGEPHGAFGPRHGGFVPGNSEIPEYVVPPPGYSRERLNFRPRRQPPRRFDWARLLQDLLGDR